jgi:HK97 gp10 family phage protein
VTSDVNGESIDRLTQTAVAVGPTKDYFYGYFQEFGTAHHGAQPWARPGFDEGKDEALAIIGREAWAAIAAKARSVSPQTP